MINWKQYNKVKTQTTITLFDCLIVNGYYITTPGFVLFITLFLILFNDFYSQEFILLFFLILVIYSDSLKINSFIYNRSLIFIITIIVFFSSSASRHFVLCNTKLIFVIFSNSLNRIKSPRDNCLY